MNSEAKDRLGLVNKMRRKGREKGLQESLLSGWTAYLICILAGLGFILLVEFGAVALLVIPAVFLVLIRHYSRLSARPYFWPTNKGLTETTSKQFTDPAYVGYILLGLSGLIVFPFFLIKTLELRDSGYDWASLAGGTLIAVFLLVIFRLDHYFLRKKLGNE